MALGVDLSILNQRGTPAFFSDIFANRPAFGFAGRVFISTDTGAIYEDTGTAWTLIADAGAGTTGTLQQVTTNGNTTAQGIVVTAGNIAIGTATAGAPLDVHTSGNIGIQINNTTTGNSYIAFQNQDIGKWRIGNVYNGGANSFDIYNTTLANTALSFNASTNAATFNNSVGINASASSYKLNVNGQGRFDNSAITNGITSLTVGGTSTNDGGLHSSILVEMFGTNTGGTDAAIRIDNQSTATTPIGLWVLNGGININTLAYKPPANGIISGGHVLIGETVDSTYSLAVTGTGRFTGDLTIKNTTTNANLFIDANASAGSEAAIYFQVGGVNRYELYTANNDTALNIYSYGSASLIFKLASTGALTLSNLGTGTVTATSGTLSTVSDMNLKIEDGFIDNALNKVMNLKPRYFKWKKESGLPTDIRQLGFYAQEVNQALGEEAANTPNNNKSWGITDRSVIAMLTKSIQELNEKLVRNNIN